MMNNSITKISGKNLSIDGSGDNKGMASARKSLSLFFQPSPLYFQIGMSRTLLYLVMMPYLCGSLRRLL